MDVASLIRERRDVLSPAERRVADLVLADPHAVAFGTVATVAAGASTSGATVVRLGTRLGLDGFAELQALVRAELVPDRHRATERLREGGRDDPLLRAAAVNAEAVSSTLARIDRAAFDGAIDLLAARSRAVLVLAADASQGIGRQFATELAMLRPGVTEVHGTEVAVSRALGLSEPGDVVVTLDLPRYDRWLVAALDQAHDAGATIIALTGSELSPIARHAAVTFVVASGAAGPFDSHVAALAVLEALVAGVAGKLRRSAVARLEAVEAAWNDAAALTDD